MMAFSAYPQSLGGCGTREFPESTTQTKVPLAGPRYTVIHPSLRALSPSSSNAIREEVAWVTHNLYRDREITMDTPLRSLKAYTPRDPTPSSLGLVDGGREVQVNVYKVSLVPCKLSLVWLLNS